MIQHPLPPFAYRSQLYAAWRLLQARRGLLWLQSFAYWLTLGFFLVLLVFPLDRLYNALVEGRWLLGSLSYLLPVVISGVLAQLLDLRITQQTLLMQRSGAASGPEPWAASLRPLLRYLGVVLLLTLLVLVGSFFIIVPGLYLLLRLYFAPMISLDQGLGVWASLRASWRLTEGHFYLLLRALALIYVSSSAFASLLYLGGVFFYPIQRLYLTQLYRYLRAEDALLAAEDAEA